MPQERCAGGRARRPARAPGPDIGARSCGPAASRAQSSRSVSQAPSVRFLSTFLADNHQHVICAHPSKTIIGDPLRRMGGQGNRYFVIISPSTSPTPSQRDRNISLIRNGPFRTDCDGHLFVDQLNSASTWFRFGKCNLPKSMISLIANNATLMSVCLQKFIYGHVHE